MFNILEVFAVDSGGSSYVLTDPVTLDGMDAARDFFADLYAVNSGVFADPVATVWTGERSGGFPALVSAYSIDVEDGERVNGFMVARLG